MFLSRQSSLGSDTGYDQYVYDEEEPNASEDTKKTSVHFDDVDDDEETEHYKKPKGSPRLSGLFHRYAHGEEGSQMLLGSSKKSFNSSNHNLQGGGRITPRGTSSGQMRRISPTAATSQGNLRIRSPRTSNPNLLLPEGVCRSTSSNSVNGGATRRSLSKGHLQTLDREEDPERWRQASLAAARGRLSRNGSKAMIGMEMGSCEADVNEVIEAPDAVGMLWTWPYSICLPISRSFFTARRFVRANHMRVISFMIMLVILALCIILAVVHLPQQHHHPPESSPPVKQPTIPQEPPVVPATPAPAPPVDVPPVVPVAPPPKQPPPIPAPAPAPVGPPIKGAAEGGKYRNLFAEMLQKTDAEVQKKLDDTWEALFNGDPENEAIYFPVDTPAGQDKMGYVMNTESNFVTSEAMSYGMMAAVQFDKKEYFDSLWTWASKYMRHVTGPYKGFFAWKCSLEGEKLDDTPAPDGEEWFSTALIFANNRWGSKGKYDYESEALNLLKSMADTSRGMFTDQAQVTLNPVQPTITNPSYHLPHFYEVWARFLRDRKDDKNADFFLKAAENSRSMLKKSVNERTGFAADYTDYDGKAYKDALGHSNFQWDAWRVVANIAVDWSWWRRDNWQQQEADRLQGFLYAKGIGNYPSTFSLDGTPITESHSAGLVAVNAVASLAATDSSVAAAFLTELWNTQEPNNKWRYYNGILLFLSLLQTSGRYKALY